MHHSFTMAHKCHSTYSQAISSYFNSCCLICQLYRPISTHVVLFASFIVLFQLILSYLQTISSYFNTYCLICKQCHLTLTHAILFTTYIRLFSSYIILFQALYHLIFTSYIILFTTDIMIFLPPIIPYHNLFANIVPPYLQLCHAIPIICPIFSPLKPIVLFLEICLYKIVIATRNSQWHFDNK